MTIATVKTEHRRDNQEVVGTSRVLLRKDLEELKARIGWDRFIEVYVNAPLEVCEQRDPKGHLCKGESRIDPGIHGD